MTEITALVSAKIADKLEKENKYVRTTIGYIIPLMKGIPSFVTAEETELYKISQGLGAHSSDKSFTEPELHKSLMVIDLLPTDKVIFSILTKVK